MGTALESFCSAKRQSKWSLKNKWMKALITQLDTFFLSWNKKAEVNVGSLSPNLTRSPRFALVSRLRPFL